ncbi:unnamed protein product [Rotaria socialis]|uniref:Sodefrin-like factor n=1 Tax=Rotaria socialis TaxID=392032 RepID=A0A820DUC0_9BILA|nr:unnamed protein product [Rotaria socialis]CAF4521474.1 unnamed protein product [Rotaria socialis]
MFAVRQTVFTCFLLLVFIQFTDGLTCYVCSNTCNDPFNPKTATQVAVPNATVYSCAKFWIATGNVARSSLMNCQPNDIKGIGVFCCNTNLCNDASKKLSIGYLVYSLGLVLIVMKLELNELSDNSTLYLAMLEDTSEVTTTSIWFPITNGN